MSSFVVVHGAWHGAWCWQRVARTLEHAGHTVMAPTLAGVGERADELNPAIGLADHVRDVLDTLDDASEPVILVGHSYAGLVVRDAALQNHEKVREVVLVEAWIGPAGHSLVEIAPDWLGEGFEQAAREKGDGWRIPAPDPALFGITDPRDASWLRQRLTEHPLKTFTDATVRGDGETAAMRAVVATLGALSFADMAEPLGIDIQRIEGGHDLMITSAQALADALANRA